MDERVWYAVLMDNGDGPAVGLWRDKATAQSVCAKQPPGHKDVVIKVVPATALAAATERAEAAEKNHEMARNEIGQLEYFIGEAGRQVEAIEKERDAAIVRADALAARLAEVDGEHPA